MQAFPRFRLEGEGEAAFPKALRGRGWKYVN